MERYVQDLLLTDKARDLNIYPIEKAKESLQLGLGVPIIAADGSKIRLNPKPRDMFYRFLLHFLMRSFILHFWCSIKFLPYICQS